MTETLNGRQILITGATGGIGRVIAETLARNGANLALVARDRVKLDSVMEQLVGGPHVAFGLDVRDKGGWDRIRNDVVPEKRLDGLVTAAAELGPIGPAGGWDVDAFRATLDANVVGTLLPIVTFLDALRMARGSIVTLSGGGATATLPRFDAYAASKAAVVRLTENLAADLHGVGVRANSVAPGFVPSQMHAATIEAGPELAGKEYFDRTRGIVLEGGGDPPELAAELIAFLLSGQADGITGKLISARWDPWRTAEFRERLRRDRHLATLRRIDEQFFGSVKREND